LQISSVIVYAPAFCFMKASRGVISRISPISLCSVATVAVGLSSGALFAAGTASDTASNYSGGGLGTTPPNNGTGFGAWNVNLQNANNPPYVGTYLSTGSSVASGGYAFGMYANGSGDNGAITITRSFTAGASGSTALFNQTLSFDLTSAGVGNGGGGPPNSLLQVNMGSAFSLSYDGTGNDNRMHFGDGSGSVQTSIDFSQLGAGIHISLAVSGPLGSTSEGYTFTVTQTTGGGLLFSQSGTFDSSAAPVSYLNFFDRNTTGDGFFNNLNINPEAVPEPTAMALLGMSATLLALWRRRKKS